MWVIALAIASAACAVLIDWRTNPDSLLRGRASASSFYLYLYLVFYLGGGVYLYLTTTHNAVFLLSLITGLLIPPILHMFLIGVRRDYRKGLSPEYSIREAGQLTNVVIVVALSVAVIGVIWYLSQTGMPLLALLQGFTSDEVRAMRAATKFGFRFAYVFRGLYAIIHVISLICFLRLLRKRTVGQAVSFLLLFFGTTILYLASSEKGPMLFYWASLGFAYTMERGSFKMSKLTRLTLVSLATGALLVITMATYGYKEFSDAIGLVSSRVFVYQVMGPAITYDIIPAQMDFLYGRSYHLPSFIVSDRFSLEAYLFYLIFHGIGSGNSPPGVLANAYANFGFLASVGEYCLVFAILFSLESRFARRRDEVSIACRAWLIQFVAMVILAGSSAAVLLSPELILVVAFYFVVGATLRSRQTLEPAQGYSEPVLGFVKR